MRQHFLQSYLHSNLSAISFKDFHDNGLFKKEKKYIIECLQIYNAVHADSECLEAFYLRLTGQAALCGGTINQEKEVVRDIFIAKMRYQDIKPKLSIRPGNTPEEILKSALLQEKGAPNRNKFRKSTWISVNGGQLFPSGVQFCSKCSY